MTYSDDVADTNDSAYRNNDSSYGIYDMGEGVLLKNKILTQYLFSDLYITSDEVDKLDKRIHANKEKIMRYALREALLFYGNDKHDIFEVADIELRTKYFMTPKKDTNFEKVCKKIKNSTDKLYTSVSIRVEYMVYLNQKVDRNYLKLKNRELYDRLFSDGFFNFSSTLYIEFDTQMNIVMYPWEFKEEDFDYEL